MPLNAFSQVRRSARLLAGVALLALTPLLATAQGLLSAAPASAVAQTEQTRTELLAHAPQGVAPGRPVWVGLQITHAPDWHTYWKNSGDSGLPTDLQWTLPPGVTAGPIAWPTPRKFPIGNLANYGYDGTVVLPVPLTVGPDFNASHVDVKLSASWLVCRKECIPEEGSFSLRIPAQGSTGLNGAAFDASFQTAPKDQPALDSRVEPGPGVLKVSLAGLPTAWRGQTLEFFPEMPGVIEPGAAWKQAWEGDRWAAEVPLSPHRTDSPAQFAMVVAQAAPPGQGAGSAGVRIDAPVQGTWPAAAPLPAAVPEALQAALDDNAARASAGPVNSTTSLTLGAALLGALLGGLILNLMPCVFPVLAIKVLAFAQHADNRRAHRANGIAYTAGVVSSFLSLGALLLALRAAGEQLGWGFQLQNPAVVAALAVLFTVIGLNLSGLFEFGSVLPSRIASLQARNPTTDAFLTGVLATAIASPCTAPFMGASLGLAIGLPPGQALAVFAVLGLGMALPYLLASWVPAVARALPRPGPWMGTFRHLMAFPMFATVVWLLWVLGQQSGIDGAAALLMLLVVLALLMWALGLRGRGRTVLAGLSLAGLAWLGWAIGPNVTRLQDSTTAGRAVATTVEGVSWQPWSPQAQAELVAQGRPVFVDFTAAWCVTCQYNKRTTLADTALLNDMAGRNVALLRADWTRRDPAVTAALASLGRNGVPVYAIYKNGQPTQVLTEVLSVEEVRAALARL
ncbi:protein-disulfide reductase DsbD family protein [Hydrogenophaga laconesensis]|uniref:Thiol:disulfide interchange protein DsbD n=1 Tax=Hydrogenophaga laconesensis TaxID=1805971 RepID=A0ABU1VHF4_9BURK|nr:thioredoxin family protein [Hydrogenophaga laconesensis]MDR7096916.1 thiol:disulfide interchange protein DsbD [Hydrogenophaga laconesensis]